MPRYFFDVYNDFDSRDPDGVELPDLDAVRHQVRQTLPSLIKDIKPSRGAAQFRVDVRDETGRRVVTSTILMVIQSIDGTESSKLAEPEGDASDAFH